MFDLPDEYDEDGLGDVLGEVPITELSQRGRVNEAGVPVGDLGQRLARAFARPA